MTYDCHSIIFILYSYSSIKRSKLKEILEKNKQFIILSELLPVPIWQHIFVKLLSGNFQVGSGSVIQEYGCADPDPKEIFTDP